MADDPIDNSGYASILFNLQTHFPGENGTLGGYDNAYRIWDKDVVTVFIGANIPPMEEGDERGGWQPMEAIQLTQAINAFKMWGEIIGLTLDPTNDEEDADITFAYSTTTDKGGTYAAPEIDDLISEIPYKTYSIADQDIWMSSGWESLDKDNIGTLGGAGFTTFLHEIGHSLGLSHPGPYNAGDDPAPRYDDDAVMVQDSGQYTIMSYFGKYYEMDVGWAPVDNPDYKATHSTVNWQTPTMYDMAALQEKYGANLTTRIGDTTYGFNASGVGDWANIYDFNNNTRPLITIYDSGGIDTLDLSGYNGAKDQVIDLRQGAYSDVMGMVSNLGIAYRTTIENAIGGAGRDLIRGNSSDNILIGNAGSDTMYGGGGIDTIDGGDDGDYIDGQGTGLVAGNEILTGGKGNDVFVYSYAYLGTIITDFGADLAFDTIDLSKQVVHNFIDLMALASQVGSDTVIDFGVASFGGLRDRLTLQNVNIDDLESGDFVFQESEISAPADFKAVANPAFNRTFYSTGAAFSDGFMVVETSLTTYNGQHALMAHRFDTRGVETGTFQINTTAFTNSGIYARSLTLANGNVVVVWMSDDTGGGGDFCFRARIFDENGVPVTANDFVVNATPPVTQISPNGWSMDLIDLVNSSSGNGFTVAWRKDVAPGDESYQTHYYERAFDNFGSPITGDIDVGAFGMPDVPDIPLNTALRELVLSNGNVLHWWTGVEQGDSSGVMKIFTRFSGDASYVVVGNNDLGQPVSADELPDGNIVFTWSGGGRSGNSYFMTGAQAVILDGDLHGFVKPGTDVDETLTGGIYNDELYGLGGNDVLIGGRDADLLDGGDGIDTVDYSGSIRGVTITLGTLAAQTGGHAAGDILVSIERVLGSGANDTFIDNDAGDNYFFGNYGADTFAMHAGNNTVDGGRGSDLIVYDNAITDFEFSYDPLNKVITIAGKTSDIPYGTNKITNVERFQFGADEYSLSDVLKRAGYNDDNHPATAVADTYRVDVGATSAVKAEDGLLVNDDIPDGDGAIVGILWNGEYVMSVDDATMGKLTVNLDGSFTYVAPAALGSHTFEYRMEDVDGSWSTSTVTFDVTLPPPVPGYDYYFVRTNTLLTLDAADGLLANDDPVSGILSLVGLVDDDELVFSMTKEGCTLNVNSDGSLNFMSPEDYRGVVTFEYSVMSESTAAASQAVSFYVVNHNVNPYGTDKVISIKEDKPYALEEEDFGFRDDGDAFVGVKIRSIFGDGSLTLNGVKVAVNRDIAVADFGKLVWTPGQDKHGDGLGGFTFSVRDDGDARGENYDLDLRPNTILFDVVEVTDVFKGKKGKDKFIGTDDHDLFDGKAGNDTFQGKGGSDTFVFKTGYDKDTIKDFDGEGKDHDIIDISFLMSVTSFKDLKKEHLETHGKDIWIDGGRGDILVIKGVDHVEKNWFEI